MVDLGSFAAGGASVAIVIKAIDEYSKELAKASSSFTKFGKFATGAAIAATGAFAAFAYSSVKSAMESEDVMFRLQQVFGETADEIALASNRMQASSVYSDEAISQAFIDLQRRTANMGLSVSTDMALVQGAMDLSAKYGTDFASVIDTIGAALNGQTRGLKQYGIELDATASRQDIYNALVEKMGTAAGAATAQVNTTSGALKNLANQYDEVKESVGARLTPAIGSLTTFLKDNMDTINVLATVITDIFILALEGVNTIFQTVSYGVQNFILTLNSFISTIFVMYDALTQWTSGNMSAGQAVDYLNQQMTGLQQNYNLEKANLQANTIMKIGNVAETINQKNSVAAVNAISPSYQATIQSETDKIKAETAAQEQLNAAIEKSMSLRGASSKAISDIKKQGYSVEYMNPNNERRGISYSVGGKKLQFGGLVSKPTVALIGEKGPEMVVPAGKTMDMMGGSGINVYIQNVNGVNAVDIAEALNERLKPLVCF